jgi:hypothetical protein
LNSLASAQLTPSVSADIALCPLSLYQPFDPTAAKNLPIAPVTSLVAEINLLTTDPIPEAMKVLKPNPATTLTLHKSTCVPRDLSPL